MQELINIVLNVIATLNDGQSVAIEKKSDNIFSITGRGRDAVGVPYGYEIKITFYPIIIEDKENISKQNENNEE